MIIELKNGNSTAKLDTHGAQLMSFIDKDVEYIWQADPSIWPRYAPVIFPIVGNLRDNKVTIKGKPFSIPMGGFAMETEFKLVEQTDTMASFYLTNSPETLAMYPYEFGFTVTYTLFDGKINAVLKVTNTGTEDMDYFIAGHPGFHLADGFNDYVVTFNKEEKDGCIQKNLEKLHLQVDEHFQFVDSSFKKWQLNHDHFNGGATIFEKINSNSITLIHKDTKHGFQFDYSGFESLAFWTVKNSNLLCIEPWNGMNVRSDEGDTFEEKFGIQHLAPKAERECTFDIISL